MKQDDISASDFPAATQYYTQYNGKRCALPLLADDYGLYYNKALFAKAGITRPPKTISELTADAKKLTVRNADGSLKVVGFDPFIGFYENVARALRRRRSAASGSTRRATSISRSDPAWAKLLKWQKSLDRLVRLQQPGQVPGRRSATSSRRRTRSRRARSR